MVVQLRERLHHQEHTMNEAIARSETLERDIRGLHRANNDLEEREVGS